jgi:hypothetical protein
MNKTDRVAMISANRLDRSRAHGPLPRWACASALLALLLLVASGGCGDGHHNTHKTTTCCPVCGDGVCSGDENGCNCPIDCGVGQACTEIVPVCGDGVCESGSADGERHESCANDCPFTCAVCQADARVYFKGTIFPEDHKCPQDATSAHRVGKLIICGSCESSAQCTDQLKPACLSHCIRDCTLDTGACCPVQECSLD